MPISACVKPEESGGSCQMTIVTLVISTLVISIGSDVTAMRTVRGGGRVVSRWADLGGPLHYLDFGGPADGPLIVCVHGLGGSAANWVAVAPLLTGGCRVVAPDLAGHGLTQSRGRGTGSGREQGAAAPLPGFGGAGPGHLDGQLHGRHDLPARSQRAPGRRGRPDPGRSRPALPGRPAGPPGHRDVPALPHPGHRPGGDGARAPPAAGAAGRRPASCGCAAWYPRGSPPT